MKTIVELKCPKCGMPIDLSTYICMRGCYRDPANQKTLEQLGLPQDKPDFLERFVGLLKRWAKRK